MNYELAKQLKDAGFVSKGRTFVVPDNSTYDWMELKTGGVLSPPLEELIEACGDRFKSLAPGAYSGWLADGGELDGDGDYEFRERGDTPTETVARLWLCLQKSGTIAGNDIKKL